MVDNVLRVTFGKETKIKSKPLYQYDYGQKLKFIDLTLPQAYEVHFSNYEKGTANVMVATSNEIDIPDVYLQTGLNIYVWVYLHTGANDGETEYQIIIPVIRRAAILDEQPTEQQESAINQAVAALNDAVSTVSSKVQAANEAMQNAQSACNLAEIYRNDAEDAAAMLSGVHATATTLQPEESATASYSQGLFTFGIPQGKQGIKGDTGESGITYQIDTTDDIIVKNKNGSQVTLTPNSITLYAYKCQGGSRELFNAPKLQAVVYGSGYIPVYSANSSSLNVPISANISDQGKVVANILDEFDNILATKTISIVLDGMNGTPGDLSYILQPSREIVVYDSGAATPLNPASLTITSYQISAGVRTLYPVDKISYTIIQDEYIEDGSFVGLNKTTGGTIGLSSITGNGYILFSAINNGNTITQGSVPIIMVNHFDESITIGSTTLTESNLIKLLELIEE